jgi:hypothetical protein
MSWTLATAETRCNALQATRITRSRASFVPPVAVEQASPWKVNPAGGVNRDMCGVGISPWMKPPTAEG